MTATTRLSSSGLTGRSSTPRLLGPIAGVSGIQGRPVKPGDDSGVSFVHQGARMASACGMATHGRSCPVAIQCNFNCRDFGPAIALKRPFGGAMSGLKVARCWNNAGDLPDVSKCFRRLKHPCWRPPVTVHGVVFDILVGSENRVPGEVRGPRQSGRALAQSTKKSWIASLALAMTVVQSDRAGWVERSETHRNAPATLVGYGFA